jgi:hypothetical protein
MAVSGNTPAGTYRAAPLRLDLLVTGVDILTADPRRPELRGRSPHHPRVTPCIGAPAVVTCYRELLREIASASASLDILVNTHLARAHAVPTPKCNAAPGRPAPRAKAVVRDANMKVD